MKQRQIGLGLVGLALPLALLSLSYGLSSHAGDPSNPFRPRLNGKICALWDDPQGVPHLRAQDDLLGVACLGFVHARDRLWQMDFFRLTAQGRKAEVLGRGEVRSDFFMRLLGLEEKADALFARMTPAQKDRLWAYTAGVNEGMKQALDKGVYEYRKLGYKPDDWKPQDSVLVTLLQSFDQTRRSFLTQIDENDWLQMYPKEAMDLFRAGGLPWETSILKQGEYPSRGDVGSSLPAPNVPTSNVKEERVSGLSSSTHQEFSDLYSGIGEGSNNWALAPSRSATGNAWFANDPHLQLRYPPFWHWVHLEAGDLNAIGATLPGLPLIVSGANRFAAWGLTNSFLNAAQVSYIPEEQLKEAQTFRPWIWVKLWKIKVPFFFKTFRRTRLGWPILPLNAPQGKAMLLRWTGFDLSPSDFEGQRELMYAKNAQEVDLALSHVGVPSWNFTFADTSGAIGYRSVGRTPKTKERKPFGIPTDNLQWLEAMGMAFPYILNPAEMPHVLKPERGFVVTANNRQWGEDAVYDEGRAQLHGFRAFRIEELIRNTPHHDVKSIQKTQCDVQAVDARFLLPAMMKILGNKTQFKVGSPEAQAWDALHDWNYEANLGCRACAVYRLWVDRVMGNSKDLDEGAFYRKLQIKETDKGYIPFQSGVIRSYNYAVRDLMMLHKTSIPLWGEVHHAHFSHLAGEGLFEANSSVGTPGDENSVNPGTSEWDDGQFWHSAGASQRLIVEMSQPPAVYDILAGGNQDLDRPKLDAPGGPWIKWRDCQLERREFPLNWSKVHSSEIRF